MRYNSSLRKAHFPHRIGSGGSPYAFPVRQEPLKT